MTLYRPGGGGLVLLGGGLPEPDDGAHHVQGHQPQPLHGEAAGSESWGWRRRSVCVWTLFCYVVTILVLSIVLSAAAACCYKIQMSSSSVQFSIHVI